MLDQAAAQLMLIVLCSSFLLSVLFSVVVHGRSIGFSDVADDAIFVLSIEIIVVLLFCLIKAALGV